MINGYNQGKKTMIQNSEENGEVHRQAADTMLSALMMNVTLKNQVEVTVLTVNQFLKQGQWIIYLLLP